MSPPGYPETFYARSVADESARPMLEGARDVEICVVGGGLAGVATALDLAERGRTVALLESRRVGWGASGRAGGFVARGFPTGTPALARRLGMDEARALFDLSGVGHALVRERIGRYRIDCDVSEHGALSCAIGERAGALQSYCETMARDFGAQIEYWPGEKLRGVLDTRRYGCAYFAPDTFTVDPLKLTRGLAGAVEANGGTIFEQSEVTGIDGVGSRHRVQTARGAVSADNVVLACGGYIENLYRPLSHATVPVSTEVSVSMPMGEILDGCIATRAAVSDLQFLPNYYRRLEDGRLLWGGGAGGWETRAGRAASRLKRDMAAFYPALAPARIDVAWSGTMSYLAHEMPALGPLGNGVWFATGFGGLGLASTSMAGHLIGTAIAQGDDRYRRFARFGLPYVVGGQVARLASQFTIWGEVLAERFGRAPPIS